MSNPTVTNKQTSFVTDANSDIVVRTIEKDGFETQVVTLDLGGAGAENLIDGALPVSGTVAISGTVPISAAALPLPSGAATEATLATLNGKVTAADTSNVTLNESSGFVTSLLMLLDRIWDSVKQPIFMAQVASGPSIRALLTADSTTQVGTVTTVTTVTTAATVTNLTNFNTIDSRELVWAAWRDNYYNGIRARIS